MIREVGHDRHQLQVKNKVLAGQRMIGIQQHTIIFHFLLRYRELLA